jgi:DNA polymerase-3 subunit gamma/tau
MNAIKLKRTHQAYVFSGSRGIGKTSIARIFAKALRCPNVVEKADGFLYSCDQCSECIEIAAGNSVNVLEIDGASNNGVDSVREIRESAKFLPTSGLYKIYIIDEVHMLSTAAFNALLKTLEEPPEHVVFIFATTESHKIPETILGRCQRFDFKRHTIAQISDRLKEVLGAEKISFEDAAISLISRAAEGSMRDGLSILDQVISFSGMKVTAQAVRESIGLIGTEMVFALLQNILNRDAKAALTVVQSAFTQGVDLKILLKVVIEMLHAVVLMQVGIEKPESNFSDDELKQIASLKNLRPLEENELIFQVFHHGLDLLSRAAQPKLIFDLLVVKTALAEQLVEVGGDEHEPSSSGRQPFASAIASPATSAIASPTARREARPVEAMPIGAPAPALPAETSAELNLRSTANETVISELAAVAKKVTAIAQEAANRAEPKPDLGMNFDFRSNAPVAKKEESIPVAASATPGSSTPQNWEGFIEACFEKKPVLAMLLESVIEWSLPDEKNSAFRLGFREKDKVKADQLTQKAFREQLSSMIESYFGLRLVAEIYFSQSVSESLAEKSERKKKEVQDVKLKEILQNQVVQEAKALFGAELTHIEFLGE